jgi:aryl-alcohol dehydrogenase-like predicted oxidoreductase
LAANPKSILGRTGLEVTRLVYGAMELRGGRTMWGKPVEPPVANRVLNAVLDAGINLIDTSPDYGDAEDYIGRAISHRRGEFLLSSKCGCPESSEGKGGEIHVFTRANVRACAERSLRRMNTDHLDLLLVHMNPSRQELEAEDTVAELVALRDEGKTRFIGMSGTLPHLPDHIAMGVFDVFQIPYSAVSPEHEALISTAARAGTGTLIRGAVARPVSPVPAAMSDFMKARVTDWRQRLTDTGLTTVDWGMPLPELLLRFILSHPDVHAVLVGTTNLEHLQANVTAASNGPLPANLYQDVRRRLKVGS